MSVTATEVLAGILLGDDAGAGAANVFVSQLEDGSQPAWNPEVVSIIAAGDTHPKFMGIQSRQEEIPYTTGQLAGVIGRLGTYGVNCSTSKAYYRTVDNMDGPAAATDAEHTLFTIAKCLSYPVSISAGHRQQAQLQARLLPLYDGSNAILARSGSSTIDDDAVADEMFQLGPLVYPGGTVLEGCDNFDLQFNPQVDELSDNSEAATTYAAVRSVSPVITFTSTERGIEDREGEVLGFKFHFVRMKNHGESYTSAELQHIIGTVDEGLLVKSAKQDVPSATRMELHCGGDPTDGWTGSAIGWQTNVAFDLT